MAGSARLRLRESAQSLVPMCLPVVVGTRFHGGWGLPFELLYAVYAVRGMVGPVGKMEGVEWKIGT